MAEFPYKSSAYDIGSGGMIRNYNQLSCHEIYFDHHPLKVAKFGRSSSRRGTVQYRLRD